MVSPDNSGEICNEYQALDVRFKVFHKINEGVTFARKDGVKISNGNWITFVDSDDIIPSNAIECLYKYAKDRDIIIGAWKKKYATYERLIPLMSDGEYSSKGIISAYLKGNCYFGPVGKLYRKELFDDNIFNVPQSIVYSEDLIMNIRLAKKAKCIYCSAYDVVYLYRLNENSASNSNKINDWESVFTIIKEEISEENIRDFYFYFLDIYKKYCVSGSHKEIINELKDYIYRFQNEYKLGVYYGHLIKKNYMSCLLYTFYKLYNKINKLINLAVFCIRNE